MKKIIIITTLFIYNLSIAQTIVFPDINFKNALIEQGVDTNNDGEIQITEAEAVVDLDVDFEEIFSLEGIEYFINIEELRCSGNQLTSLDLSQNINLTYLSCFNNQLTYLNVTQNINLETLSCWFNQLTNLDVSQNLSLKTLVFADNLLSNIDISQNINIEELICSNNPLTSLDVSLLPNLTGLECSNNQLTSLFVNNGNNHNMYMMVSLDNPSLECIQVDDENATYPVCQEFPWNGWCKDETAIYSENCELGITEQNLQKFVQLYPNPVKDVLQIHTENNVVIKKVQVYNVLGKKLLETNTINQLDVSAFASGLLFVKIETDNGILVKKVVKE